MINKDDYTPEEWQALVKLPETAARCVIASGRSGPIQLYKEFAAISKAMDQARAIPNSLVVAVAYDIREHNQLLANVTKPDSVPEQDAEKVRAHAMDQIANVNRILEAKNSTGEAEGYKRWIIEVARATAEAAKEGSFLGIGGTLVTPDEEITITVLAAALGVPAGAASE